MADLNEGSKLILSAIQLTSAPCVETNLKAIATQLAQLTAHHSAVNQFTLQHLVVLPECCLFFGATDSSQLALAVENEAEQAALISRLQIELSQLAQQYQVYLVAGTIPIRASSPNKYTNTSCIFSPSGEILGRYDKIHLFDVNVKDNAQQYRESRYTQAGKSPCVVTTPLANIGLTVCFDLRFPVLFQHLTTLGASIITVPSAFTRVTGKAHWQILLQARAIENQVYIIAAGQEGVHENGRETWGHSMIISPWGEVLTTIEQGEGYISTEFLPTEINRVRTSMPLNSPNFSE